MTNPNEQIVARNEFLFGHRKSVLKGILWKEWLTHGNMIISFFAVWLVGVWVLLLFSNSLWICVFGVIYGLTVGSALGGSEVKEGSEEFSFSLPPTRSERYLVRLALGSGSLLLFVVFGLAAVAFDLPQAIWGLFVQSGFTEPFTIVPIFGRYTLALLYPLAAFSLSFAFSGMGNSYKSASSAWSLAALLLLTVPGLGMWLSVVLFKYTMFFFYIPELLILGLTVAGFRIGYRVQTRKEGISRPTSIGNRGPWWEFLVVVIALIIIIIMYVLLHYFIANVSALFSHADVRIG
ncbi:MAG: hypothetical protein ABIH23_10980 [bacterium]